MIQITKMTTAPVFTDYKEILCKQDVKNYLTKPSGLLWKVVVCFMLINRISESPLLIREGRKTLKSLQVEIKKITDQLKKGNINPGIGNKYIGGGITESRTRGGARVYWRIREGQIEILGVSGKDNQQRVVNEVLQCFGGQ